MALKPKASRPALPPHLRKVVLLALAAVACVIGAWVSWHAWQGWRQSALGPELVALRDATAASIQQHIDQARQRLVTAVADEYVRADASAGARPDVVKRLQQAWPELRDVEVFDASLDDAFAREVNQFGYTRLALLNQAVDSGTAAADIVLVGGNPSLGLAAPIQEGEERHGVVLGWLPLEPVLTPVQSSAAGSGYLELRTGSRVLGASGDAALQPQAGQPVSIAGTSIELAIGLPQVEPMLVGTPAVQLGLGLFALLLGGGLVWQALRPPREGDAAAGELTLGQALQQEPPAPVVARRTAPEPAPAPPPATIDRSIFRAYDIRGIVGETLDEGVARLIGQAVGTLMREQGLKEIVVGRDGRLSGPSLSAALIEGLRRAGRDVIDIGLAPTPLVYFGTFQCNTGCGIAVTGSHNPPNYNGFKIVVGGDTLSGKAVLDLYARIAENRLDGGGGGGLQHLNLVDDYVSRVAGDIQLERKLKVVVDAGNGVAGMLAPQLLEAIGAEVVPLYCEVDGEFPNHHPDPSEPHNLTDLITFVGKFGADLGLAFDGDGDRLGVVTRRGEVIFPDRLLMLFAQDVLSRNPGASVIYDVKCTGHLAAQILRHGGSPIMWKTGHSLIKAKMKETEAELAGEMSGHFFFRERWFGFDDAIYSAARLLEILAGDDRSAEEVLDELPKGVSTPELKVPMAEGEHYAFVEKFREKAKFEGAKIATIDGVRADWPDGWGLVRSSNTTPCLVLRFDADNGDALVRIQRTFREQLLAIDPSLKLPF
jgi:phosphomannomutase / phosphoglucomutase